MRSDNSAYITGVLAKLSSNPTAQDLDYFIEAYARIGYIAATAQGIAETAEAERRFAEAGAYTKARSDGAGSAKDAEIAAFAATRDERTAEIKARETSQKLRNLLLAIEQAINGIKFLNRATDVTLPSVRR